MFNIGDEVRYKPEYLSSLPWVTSDNKLYKMTYLVNKLNLINSIVWGSYVGDEESMVFLGMAHNLELVEDYKEADLSDWL